MKKNIIKKLVCYFLPTECVEFILFSVIFLLYAGMALYMGLETNITDQAFPMKTDAYFSFDNPTLMHHVALKNSNHPFLFLLTLPLMYIGIVFSVLWGIKAKTCFLLLICSLLVALSNIYVYRYLKHTINIKLSASVLLTLFYAFTSTCLILSFTFESYLFSMFFLTFSIYYYSTYLKNNKEIPLVKSTVLAFILGGITITNLGKGILPLFFTSNNKLKFLKQGLFIGVLFVSVVLAYIGFESIDYGIRDQDKYIEYLDGFGYTVFCFFLGASIIFPKIVPFISKENPSVRIIEFGTPDICYSLFIAVILLFVIYSLFINLKNKQVQLLLTLFLIDFVIHIVFRFGAGSLFIYAGHWVFIVPMLLGWLYKAVDDKTQRILNYVYVALLICVIINNGYWIIEFMRFAKTLYPS